MLPSSAFLRFSPSFDAVCLDSLMHGKFSSHLLKCKRNEMHTASSLTRLRNVPFSKRRCKLLIYSNKVSIFIKVILRLSYPTTTVHVQYVLKNYTISLNSACPLMLKLRRQETGHFVTLLPSHPSTSLRVFLGVHLATSVHC